MPGKTLPRIPLRHLMGGVALIGLLVLGVAGAGEAATVSRLGHSQADSVPSWCHKNLQLVSQVTNWSGYRDATILKRKFSPLFSASVYYRGYLSDRNIFVFSGELERESPHLDFDEFATYAGEYNPSPTPLGSTVSNRLRGSAYETLVWNIVDSGLLAVQATNPWSVTVFDEVTLGVTPKDLRVEYILNRYNVFTVNGTDSIRIYTLPFSNWILPEVRGTLETPGDATALEYQDSMLFVADGAHGIQVVDVSDIDDISIVGHIDTQGPARELAIMDTLLFVAEWDNGVEIFSIANTDSIRLLAHVDTPGLAHDVAPDSSHYFSVADWNGGLRVYDYADLDSIFLYAFYGIGAEYHSVAMMDSVVFAGDHSGFQVLRLGDDREAAALTATITQTPYLRKYMRAYVLASECLADVPTVQHLVLPRQSTLEDFEGYAASDTLRLHWTTLTPTDTISLATAAFEGSQSMQMDFTLPELQTSWAACIFDESRDWRLFDRLAFHFKTAGDSILGSLEVRAITAAGDTISAEPAVIGSAWSECALDLSLLEPRNEIQEINIGVSAALSDTTVFGTLLVDHLLLKRVNVAEPAKGLATAFLGDTTDVDIVAVSEERHLYTGDFQLVASDTGMTNALLVTAIDNSGNSSIILKEYRAQLVVPAKGGALRSPDSRLAIQVPPQATDTGAFFSIVPEESVDRADVPAGAAVMSRPYAIACSEDNLRRDVEVVFQLGRTVADPGELGIYRKKGNDWLYLGGRYDAEDQAVRVRTRDLGTVVLLASPNHPGPRGPDTVALHCYPNPFNPNTTISYTCPSRSSISLKIYDVEGRLVRTLVDDMKDPGLHFVTWRGRTDASAQATSGIYFARLEVGEEIRTIKLVLIR